MTWIQTFTGKRICPFAAKVEDIDILDIAHALSLKCRFTGHCRSFYTVAEHSHRISMRVPRDCALEALLHDASEAYLPDIASPLKNRFAINVEDNGSYTQTMHQFRAVEDGLLRVIFESFGLRWPVPDVVHEYDQRFLATEARDLMHDSALNWKLDYDPLELHIEPWPADVVEGAFLDRFKALLKDRIIGAATDGKAEGTVL